MWAGIDFALVWNSLPELMHGLALTLELTVITIFGGIALAVPLGILRAQAPKPVSAVIWAYTYFFRGTPMLVQLFLIYYGLAEFKFIRASFLWEFLREGFWCSLIAFTVNTAAYTTEIVAGAIKNVRFEDIEAAKSLGMSWALRMRRIVLPQALRIMLPAYVNEVVFILQSTSLASLVTLLDLTGVARVIIARTYSPYELFISIGLIYLGLTYLLLAAFGQWERHLYRHLADRDALANDGALVLR